MTSFPGDAPAFPRLRGPRPRRYRQVPARHPLRRYPAGAITVGSFGGQRVNGRPSVRGWQVNAGLDRAIAERAPGFDPEQFAADEHVATMLLYVVNAADGHVLDDLDAISDDAGDLGWRIWGYQPDEDDLDPAALDPAALDLADLDPADLNLPDLEGSEGDLDDEDDAAGEDDTVGAAGEPGSDAETLLAPPDEAAIAGGYAGGPVLLVDNFTLAPAWRGTALTPALAAMMLTPFAAMGIHLAALYAHPASHETLAPSEARKAQRRIAAMWTHLGFEPFTEHGHLACLLNTGGLAEVLEQAAEAVPDLKDLRL